MFKEPMFVQLIAGTVLIVICVVIHAMSLELLLRKLKRHGPSWDAKLPHFGHILIMIVVVLGLFLTHTFEAWIWAAFYWSVGETQSFAEAIYFSTVTFTTLGFGDVTLTTTWRLASALQAVSGILLFGWSTAFLVNVRSFFWQKHGVLPTPPNE